MLLHCLCSVLPVLGSEEAWGQVCVHNGVPVILNILHNVSVLSIELVRTGGGGENHFIFNCLSRFMINLS